MKPCVFIHTNHRQYLGALVSAHSMQRNSNHSDEFDVRIIDHEDYPFFAEHEGKPYLRDGVERNWRNDDLQSFTPLRFMPPELMGYQGRAVVVDPDVFAVGDVCELLTRDMAGKAIMCRTRAGAKRISTATMPRSVMLLDCAKLTHWQVEEQFRRAVHVRARLSQVDQPAVRGPPSTIGLLEPEWNDFDRLTAQTKMVHNTRRKTQPWKSGLPVDFIPAETQPAVPADRLADARAAQAVRRLRPARPATARIPTATRRTCSSACCASASSRAP